MDHSIGNRTVAGATIHHTPHLSVAASTTAFDLSGGGRKRGEKEVSS
jgi:hypothetical protein